MLSCVQIKFWIFVINRYILLIFACLLSLFVFLALRLLPLPSPIWQLHLIASIFAWWSSPSLSIFRVSIRYLLFSSFWSSLLHSLLVFRQHCSIFFLYWQWILLKYTVFIVLSVVYIWGVISYNTLLSKSVQIKFRMFIIHTNFLLFFAIYIIFFILTVHFVVNYSIHSTVSYVHFGCI